MLFSSVLCATLPLRKQRSVSTTSPLSLRSPNRSPEGKKEEAERAAARAKAHHFDRVVIIVLENVDYERAARTQTLPLWPQRGASFTNFHAMFHPSYPNYLAMVAGTDFGIHRRGSFLGRQPESIFRDDAAHKTIADRLISVGTGLQAVRRGIAAMERVHGTSSAEHWHRNEATRRSHVPFLSFREVQQKWCDRVIRVDSSKSDNFFVQDARKGLVAYSLYSPNMNHDGHDTNAAVAGAWVRKLSGRNVSRETPQGNSRRSSHSTNLEETQTTVSSRFFWVTW